MIASIECSIMQQRYTLLGSIALLCRYCAQTVQQKRWKLRNNFASKCRFEWLLSMLTSLFSYVYSTPCCNGWANGFVVACAALLLHYAMLLCCCSNQTEKKAPNQHSSVTHAVDFVWKIPKIFPSVVLSHHVALRFRKAEKVNYEILRVQIMQVPGNNSVAKLTARFYLAWFIALGEFCFLPVINPIFPAWAQYIIKCQKVFSFFSEWISRLRRINLASCGFCDYIIIFSILTTLVFLGGLRFSTIRFSPFFCNFSNYSHLLSPSLHWPLSLLSRILCYQQSEIVKLPLTSMTSEAAKNFCRTWIRSSSEFPHKVISKLFLFPSISFASSHWNHINSHRYLNESLSPVFHVRTDRNSNCYCRGRRQHSGRAQETVFQLARQVRDDVASTREWQKRARELEKVFRFQSVAKFPTRRFSFIKMLCVVWWRARRGASFFVARERAQQFYPTFLVIELCCR